MQEEIEQIIETKVDRSQESREFVELHEDYSKVLKHFGLKYKRTDYYLEVGEPSWIQGWILNISVIQIQFLNLLETVIPVLIREEIPFKIARSSRKARTLLGGELGWFLLGKVLCIYPQNENKAVELAKELIILTRVFKGPEILTDRRLGSVIYTQYGAGKSIGRVDELVPEKQTIPFQIPNGITWPFGCITTLKAPKKESVLQDRYKPMYMLKEDAKGTVRKGLWLKKFYVIKWCVIKEGRQNMIADISGRDIIERLHWQYDLHNALKGVVPLPAIYDLFEENGDAYLIMEYIRGISLHKRVEVYFQENIWCNLPITERLNLLDYCLQVLDIIDTMHSRGYIHRDITSNNFLVNKKNQLCMIDLELSYAIHSKKPFPPFRLGTPGFMSPEQEATQEPTVEQDIYAIGAVLLELLTGLPPDDFAQKDKLTLKRQLEFFIDEPNLVNLLGDCFSIDPSERPRIQDLKRCIEEFRGMQSGDSKGLTNLSSTGDLSKKILKGFISRSLEGLGVSGILNNNNLWVSKVSGEDGSDPQLVRPIAIREDFCEGIAGVMWLLARAHGLGFSIEICKDSYEKSVDHIRNKIAKEAGIREAGLYTGTAGVAVALAAGIKYGLIRHVDETIAEIKFLLEKNAVQGSGIVQGLAGQGMALLHVAPLLGDKLINPFIHKIVYQLLERQQEDGSWIVLTDRSKKQVKATGFGHGVAGISCFLLCYLMHFKNDPVVRQSVYNALEWLVRKSYKKRGVTRWPRNDNSKQATFDFQDGCMGVMLSLVKGYQVFEEDRYRELAEDCLSNYHPCSASRDLTQVSGLAGQGEVFLEAARIFGGGEWQKRADWIAEFLLHYFKQEKEGERYWIADASAYPTAGLMMGNSGVIHFLLRYYQPGSLSHPLLSN